MQVSERGLAHHKHPDFANKQCAAPTFSKRSKPPNYIAHHVHSASSSYAALNCFPTSVTCGWPMFCTASPACYLLYCLQAAGYPNQCFRPTEVASPNATYLYGECQFYEDNVGARAHVRSCCRP
jgi:hypothetical protein